MEIFKTDYAPAMITGMVLFNVLMWLIVLIPALKLAFLGMMIGVFGALALTKINDEPLVDIIGKKIGAVFSKNHLLALFSVLFLTFLSLNFLILYRIGQF